MRTEKDTETMDLYNKYNASEWLTRKEAIRRKRLDDDYFRICGSTTHTYPATDELM